jgi:hypothetical protein
MRINEFFNNTSRPFICSILCKLKEPTTKRNKMIAEKVNTNKPIKTSIKNKKS